MEEGKEGNPVKYYIGKSRYEFMTGFFVSVFLQAMKYPSIQELYRIYLKCSIVTTDSRQTPPGSVFFALKGEHFDGNQFAEKAIAQGCGYAVIDDEKYYKNEKHLLVKDCLQTLQQLAKYHREQLKIPFIAITGSNGKTTTKELLKCVLEKKYKVLATKGNLNNHIGVPLTLLTVTPEVDIAIIEMGANHIGEIAMLCEIAMPDYGLITNIGKAHLGEFGSFEGVIKAKTEMYRYIKGRKGKIFINADNELLVSNASGLEKITYGSSPGVFCSCSLAGANPYLQVKFQDQMISTQLIGKYNFENAAAAICMGKYFDVEDSKIKAAIESYIPSNNRSQAIQTKKNKLILDAYNANPSSMKAAIENFAELKEENKWLLLGDMLELGTYEIQEHMEILELIASKNFQNVILVGERFAKAVPGISKAGLRFYLFSNSDELITRLQSQSPVNAPASILIKGSRGMKLEKVVEFL